MNMPEAHAAADLFPIDSEDVSALADDIKEHGQTDPILLTHDGLILDGRNRWLACEKAGVEPKTKKLPKMTEAELMDLAWSKNGMRRDLTKSQRACLAAVIMAATESRQGQGGGRPRNDGEETCGNSTTSNGEKTRDIIGKRFKVSGSMVERAQKLLKKAPDIFATVKSGATSLSNAFEDWQKAQEDIKEIEDNLQEAMTTGRLALLAKRQPDLAEQVANGVLSLKDAQAEADKREAAAEAEKRRLRHIFEIITVMVAFIEKSRTELPEQDLPLAIAAVDDYLIETERVRLQQVIALLESIFKMMDERTHEQTPNGNGD